MIKQNKIIKNLLGHSLKIMSYFFVQWIYGQCAKVPKHKITVNTVKCQSAKLLQMCHTTKFIYI